MSDTPDPFDQQIAALEAALKLPLPDDSRQRLATDLLALQAKRAARAAQGAAIQGTAEVSGTLYGNAIGVNLGTAQTFFGTQPPTAAGPQSAAQVTITGAGRNFLILRGVGIVYAIDMNELVNLCI